VVAGSAKERKTKACSIGLRAFMELQAYCERTGSEDVTRYQCSPRHLHADCLYAGRANGGLKMWDDPIVDEVRRARLEIEKECGGDFDQIYERALEVQKKTTSKLVSRPDPAKITMAEIDEAIAAHRREKRL
jgi:hypothetical protein